MFSITRIYDRPTCVLYFLGTKPGGPFKRLALKSVSNLKDAISILPRQVMSPLFIATLTPRSPNIETIEISTPYRLFSVSHFCQKEIWHGFVAVCVLMKCLE